MNVHHLKMKHKRFFKMSLCRWPGQMSGTNDFLVLCEMPASAQWWNHGWSWFWIFFLKFPFLIWSPTYCVLIHTLAKGHFFPFLFPPSLCLKAYSIHIKGIVYIFGGPCLILGIGSNPLQLPWEWTWELWFGIWTLFLSVFLFQTSNSFFVAEARVSLASLSHGRTTLQFS